MARSCYDCSVTGRDPCSMRAVYSHCVPCALSDGTPYRIAIPRGSTEREIHAEDCDALLERFAADAALRVALFWISPIDRAGISYILNPSDAASGPTGASR